MADPTPPRLILASGSWGRRDLLERAGYAFDATPSGVDEPEAGFADPRSFTATVAWMKAAAVAPRVASGLVLAADSIGWIDGGPVLKPADEADARRILRTLAGREHELWTGVVVWRRPDDMQVCWQERSRVVFAALTEAQIDAYLATRVWRGCSGAYAIQENDDPYVRVVEGSVSNVVGLPMERTREVLQWFGGLSPRAAAAPA
jgi:nucleoside triphosphate pyrophosphatase